MAQRRSEKTRTVISKTCQIPEDTAALGKKLFGGVATKAKKPKAQQQRNSGARNTKNNENLKTAATNSNIVRQRSIKHPESFPILRQTVSSERVRSVVESLRDNVDSDTVAMNSTYQGVEATSERAPDMPNLDLLVDENNIVVANQPTPPRAKTPGHNQRIEPVDATPTNFDAVIDLTDNNQNSGNSENYDFSQSAGNDETAAPIQPHNIMPPERENTQMAFQKYMHDRLTVADYNIQPVPTASLMPPPSNMMVQQAALAAVRNGGVSGGGPVAGERAFMETVPPHGRLQQQFPPPFFDYNYNWRVSQVLPPQRPLVGQAVPARGNNSEPLSLIVTPNQSSNRNASTGNSGQHNRRRQQLPNQVVPAMHHMNFPPLPPPQQQQQPQQQQPHHHHHQMVQQHTQNRQQQAQPQPPQYQQQMARANNYHAVMPPSAFHVVTPQPLMPLQKSITDSVQHVRQQRSDHGGGEQDRAWCTSAECAWPPNPYYYTLPRELPQPVIQPPPMAQMQSPQGASASNPHGLYATTAPRVPLYARVAHAYPQNSSTNEEKAQSAPPPPPPPPPPSSSFMSQPKRANDAVDLSMSNEQPPRFNQMGYCGEGFYGLPRFPYIAAYPPPHAYGMHPMHVFSANSPSASIPLAPGSTQNAAPIPPPAHIPYVSPAWQSHYGDLMGNRRPALLHPSNPHVNKYSAPHYEHRHRYPDNHIPPTWT